MVKKNRMTLCLEDDEMKALEILSQISKSNRGKIAQEFITEGLWRTINSPSCIDVFKEFPHYFNSMKNFNQGVGVRITIQRFINLNKMKGGRNNE